MTDRTEAEFLLDSSLFIEAYRRYYGLDICPGFWDCLLHHCSQQRLLSIDRVREELKQGGGLLADWANQKATDLFASSREPLVVAEYGNVMAWVYGSAQFLGQAKADFASGADGWLVAYARVHGRTLVTQEVYNPSIRKRVPLPNVCREFGVFTTHTFRMLRELNVAFHWTTPSA